MSLLRPTSLLLALATLAGCAGQPASVSIEPSTRALQVSPGQQAHCTPIELKRGQTLILSLPSNPTTGFRWQLFDGAPQVLAQLGPEVYRVPEEAGIVGSAGLSTWRFQATLPGQGRLLLQYQRPWEQGVAPALIYDCAVQVD
ncbi:inhibitor of cysteine peptidase [Pseudomonas fluvialis]|uniref:Inhibitor of cysteine peptidase n=1 Tax=Pseudomonas fluvialis TaxID=1793966 RepID=A0A7X0BUA5_9PSED|nr:protease inhibitor I42 family protein [Pseudomonas fluvialis]MBB6341970.1 inhibitor of cysteine peptidase [Pseudomonas fluvialis]